MPLPLYDAHNHLHDEWLSPHWDKLAEQLPRLGLRRAVVNGTHAGDWPPVATLADTHAWILPSFGLHPWHVGKRDADWLGKLCTALENNPHAAVGEIGLDRWMLERAAPDDARLVGLRRAPLDEQRAVFSAQLSLAAELNRPATIHCLDAWGALQEAMRHAPARPTPGFLLHAYSGPPEMIPAFAKLGAYFSFNGFFLDPRRAQKLATFRRVPPERLLIETDAPAMPLPQPWRTHKLPPAPGGETVNHPGNLEAAYAALASFLGETPERLASRVEENFHRLFGGGG